MKTKGVTYMSKNDNPHAIRLYESVLKHSNRTAADKIANQYPLSKAADIDKEFTWAESICADLENEFDDEMVKTIRMDCVCGPDMGNLSNFKNMYQSSTDLEEFVSNINNQNQGFTIEYDDNALYYIYPECYCPCVNRIDKPISKTWCFCTLGYTKKMFEYILDRKVDVSLIESIKTGGSICKIKVTYFN